MRADGGGGDVRSELEQHMGIPARKSMRPWVVVWLDILEGQSVWLSLPDITSVRTVWGSTRRPKREWARYGNWEPGARRRVVVVLRTGRANEEPTA